MQWLIDIITERVIAEIGIPPTFIDRGDPPGADYILAQFIVDWGWHELDLSAIVPAGAKAILFQINGIPLDINAGFYMQRHGNVNFTVYSQYAPNVVGASHNEDLTVACDEDRKVDYLVGVGHFVDIDLVVKGWWL